MQTLIPDGPLPIVDPITHMTIDVRPIVLLLHQKYQGDKEQLVHELNQLNAYLMQERCAEESAAGLRQKYNLIADLAAAIDSVTIAPAR
ncbi:hypothetical protein [Hymenobacter pini]|uniref:hypothetical protein n=1 Tax=Hymenobacter pini TaxID=2880879 RepID=UPI001CF2BB3C|nr:hypothetical protein [Hymenobacter pini]MCA8831980.1 hypothetical protein [Hymenobacter pini]